MVLNEDSIPEFIGQIVDVFEDFCAENEITWPNKDRDEYVKDGGCEEDEAAIIFGSDYDYIAIPVQNEVEDYELMQGGKLTYDWELAFISKIISEFYDLLLDKHALSEKLLEILVFQVACTLKIDKILRNWDLLKE